MYSISFNIQNGRYHLPYPVPSQIHVCAQKKFKIIKEPRTQDHPLYLSTPDNLQRRIGNEMKG